LGRYITSDPIGLFGGVNTFGYVGGDPVGFVDPKGLLNVDFSAGFSIPVFPGFTYDHSVSSIIKNLESGNVSLESMPHNVTNTVGQVGGAGVSIGLSNINDGSGCSENWSVNYGVSKYTGITLRFLQQQDKSLSVFNPARYIDSFKINIGVGYGTSVTITDEIIY
jgi:uncharacterized protein RhaS with RHS repeats